MAVLNRGCIWPWPIEDVSAWLVAGVLPGIASGQAVANGPLQTIHNNLFILVHNSNLLQPFPIGICLDASIYSI